MKLSVNNAFTINFIVGAAWFFGITLIIAAIAFGSKYLEGNGTIIAPLVFAILGILTIVFSNRISSKK
jgi:hypothetical protein